MRKQKLQKFLQFYIVVFSLTTAASNLFELEHRIAIPSWVVWAIIILLAIPSGFYFFKAGKNFAFKELLDVMPVKYTVRQLEASEDLHIVAGFDQDQYGIDSVDYEGLLGWWNRYNKGISILLADAEIIGAIGIWPVCKEAFDKIINGEIDEPSVKKSDICQEKEEGAFSYWYLGDIVILKKYRRKLRNLALVLLEGAVRDWLDSGHIADHIEVCAFGFTDQGKKMLERFSLVSKAQPSPKRFPVYYRKLTLNTLRDEYEYDLKELLSKLRKRNPPRSLAYTASVRKQWLISGAIALIVFTGIWGALGLRPATVAKNELLISSSPEELAKQNLEVLRIGLRDHVHCALDVWDGETANDNQMQRELGRDFSGLLSVARANLPEDYNIVLAHRCKANERAYIHLIFKAPGVLMSLTITRKAGESFPQNSQAVTAIVSDINLYRNRFKALEIAGFQFKTYLIFFVSNLGEKENLQIASALAPAVRDFLIQVD